MSHTRPYLSPFFQPFAATYGVAMRLRQAAYRYGLFAQRSLPVPVISVGNLTVGGTGKTPVVIWLVRRLMATGRRVAVLSRGYRRHSRTARLLVSDGRQIVTTPLEAGDEPYLIAERCPGAVVAVGANRYQTGRWLLSQFPIDCVVLDDGFQHVALRRDLNLLLVDVTDPEGLDDLLPAGRLREPLSAAGRADAVLLTRAEDSATTTRLRDRLRPCVPFGQAMIRVTFPVEMVLELGTGRMQESAALAGRIGLAVSGIANAASFRAVLERGGVKVAGAIEFRDHHHYSPHDLARMQAEAVRCGSELILTTEKDAVKIAPLLSARDQGIPIMVVRLACEVIEGQEAIDRLIFDVIAKAGWR